MNDELSMAMKYTLSVFDILTPDQQVELIKALILRIGGVPDQRNLTVN